MRKALTLAVWLGCAACAVAGKPEPVAFHSADGAQHTLAELRGHPAVVNFWATWCGPCREEMPRLQKLADAYAAKDVRFVAISIDDAETQTKIPKVLADRKFRVPVWTGASEATLQTLKLGNLVPATMILDENGELIGRIEGEATDKDIRSRVDWLLNGRVGKPPKPVQRNDW